MRNRIVALAINIIGGYFGLHKFYLGQNFAGILYLAFCWSGIPIILSFFDFLGLVFMSDRDFDRQFNGISQAHSIPEHPRPAFREPVTTNKQSSKEIAETLQQLKKLYETGIITAEEYETKRRKLLDLI